MVSQPAKRLDEEPKRRKIFLCFEFLGRNGDFVEMRCLTCGYVFPIDPKSGKDPRWRRGYTTMSMCPKCRVGVGNGGS